MKAKLKIEKYWLHVELSSNILTWTKSQKYYGIMVQIQNTNQSIVLPSCLLKK